MRWLRARIHHRGLHGHAHISKQRRVALYLTVFAAVRTAIWVTGMLLIGVSLLVGYEHGFLHAFMHLNSTIVWVVFISYYCNASTDAANMAAGISALFSADSHQDSEHTRQTLGVDFAQLERDVAQLAALTPGPEAQSLADEICQRLTSKETP